MQPVREFVVHGETPATWEFAAGKTTIERTRSAGRKAIKLRNEILKVTASVDGITDAQILHNRYIHHLGSDALKIQIREDKLAAERKAAASDRIKPS